jgi:hypothetical protein
MDIDKHTNIKTGKEYNLIHNTDLHIYRACCSVCEMFACGRELTAEMFNRQHNVIVLDISSELLCDVRNAPTYLSLLIVTYSGFSRRRTFTSSRSSRPSFCGFTGRFRYSEVYL